MKEVIKDFIGKVLHMRTNKKLSKNAPINDCVILMSGPSNELDDFSEKKYDIAITSNLTDPKEFCKRVKSKNYIHCFSDPDIINSKDKRNKLLHILDFSKNRDDYILLVPFSFIKCKEIRKSFFLKSLMFYNTNNSFRENKGLLINNISFPNMNTIMLDCALPLASYLKANNIFISGFDANYGVGAKNYSKTNMTLEDNSEVLSGWNDIVKKNALILTTILEEINKNKVTYSNNSGFGKYLYEKLNNNW